MYSTTALRIRKAETFWPYVQIARPDHWFKNTFMLLGVLFAVFYEPGVLTWLSLGKLGLGVVATCLIASSNYVINELLDGRSDSFHPQKRTRPVPAGKVQVWIGITEWLTLALAGIVVAYLVNVPFALCVLVLWLMGIVYNVPPLRTKEVPYIDVLSESLNNPLRLFLGWFAVVPYKVPPLSLVLAFWMIGAFFMAMKRFAEYRHLGDANIAAGYRKSFRYYTEERLLVSVLFYAVSWALFSGIFIVRYRIELILLIPLAAGFFAHYLRLGFQTDSLVQLPEKLYRDRPFVFYLVGGTLLFIALMFIQLPFLYEIFNVERASVYPLWTLGTNPEP